MATKGFLKKNWQKDATDVLVEAAIRGVGGLGTAFATNKFFVIKKNQNGEENKMLYNIGGPIMTAVGILGDMMVADSKFKAFFQGMSTYGIMHSLAVIGDKSIAPKIGMSGLGEAVNEDVKNAALMSGVGALGVTTPTDENTTSTTLPELAEYTAGQQTIVDTDGKTYNNDWQYLAENIDNADQITKTVNGIDSTSEAASLFGVETQEEANNLTNMF